MKRTISFTVKSLFSNVGLRLLAGFAAIVCFAALAVLMFVNAPQNVQYSGPLTAGAVTSIMVVFVIAVFISIEIASPLHRLLETTNTLIRNTFGVRIKTKSRNEFARLEELLDASSKLWQQKHQAELDEAHQHLKKTFNRISQAVTSVLDLKELLTLILDIAKEEVGLEKVLLYLSDTETSQMELKLTLGLDGQRERFSSRTSKEIAAEVAQNRQLVVGNTKDIFPELNTNNENGYILAAPLLVKNQLLGVIISQPHNKLSHPDKEDTQLFLTLANQAAIAVYNSRLYNETQLQAITDGLTKVYNHRFFQERLADEIERASRFQHSLSLLMLDIDHFKQYNDTYGHLKGDEVLAEIANILRMVSRKTDIVARYGGEEFAILLPETTKEGARVTAEKILNTVDEHEFPGPDPNTFTQLTVSIGVATYPREATSTPDLIRKADNRLYEAKKKGRNRVCSGLTAR